MINYQAIKQNLKRAAAIATGFVSSLLPSSADDLEGKLKWGHNPLPPDFGETSERDEVVFQPQISVSYSGNELKGRVTNPDGSVTELDNALSTNITPGVAPQPPELEGRIIFEGNFAYLSGSGKGRITVEGSADMSEWSPLASTQAVNGEFNIGILTKSDPNFFFRVLSNDAGSPQRVGQSFDMFGMPGHQVIELYGPDGDVVHSSEVNVPQILVAYSLQKHNNSLPTNKLWVSGEDPNIDAKVNAHAQYTQSQSYVDAASPTLMGYNVLGAAEPSKAAGVFYFHDPTFHGDATSNMTISFTYTGNETQVLVAALSANPRINGSSTLPDGTPLEGRSPIKVVQHHTVDGATQEIVLSPYTALNSHAEQAPDVFAYNLVQGFNGPGAVRIMPATLTRSDRALPNVGSHHWISGFAIAGYDNKSGQKESNPANQNN